MICIEKGVMQVSTWAQNDQGFPKTDRIVGVRASRRIHHLNAFSLLRHLEKTCVTAIRIRLKDVINEHL
jgi:hypothetical protein